MTRYRYATPRPVSDDSPRRARTGAPLRSAAVASLVLLSKDHAGTSRTKPSTCRMAYPRHAHQVRPEPLPANRSRIAPDLLALAVILAVVLAASLAGVRLP